MKKIDIFIVVFCIIASVIFIRAFWLEYNRTFTKLNESPVGTISFKKRTAQRKIIDRIAWDLLKQSSDVYNGDIIRTIEASSAVISFRDETTKITLNANTLIQIFYNDIDGARIDFSGGNLEVNSGISSVVINSGSSEIVVTGQANLDKKDEGFSFSVLEGEAVFDGEIIETGNIIILDEQGERDKKPAIAVTSLRSGTPVVFEWNEYNFDTDTFVIIETSLDPSFKHIVQTETITGTTAASILMEPGEYFWRAYPANAVSREPANSIYPSGALEIVSVQETSALAVEVPDPEIEQDTSVAVTSAVNPAQTTAPAVNPINISSAQINQTFFNKNNWEVFLHGQSTSTRNRVTLDYQTGKEIIQGQEKDVLTITVDLPRSGEWRQGVIDITNDIIIQKLKTAEGLRFKVIGDAGRGWQILVQTSTVRDAGFHEFTIPAAGDQAVEVNIPFSSLRQPEWASRVRFNRNNITILQIRRRADNNQSFSGSSTIKIFDFEIY